MRKNEAFSSNEGILTKIPASLRHFLSKAILHMHPASRGCGQCTLRPLPLTERGISNDLAPDFPVDVVYTWVDGNDPAHAAKRATYSPDKKDMAPDSLELARFRDNEELRYSLRSLEAFAPWVRRIFIVTDGQTPAWLNTTHPKIRIVDHTECIPHHFLPTFNSHVIEAYLHRIPGLAEHFIYVNDDVMLGRPCRKTDFFTPNGMPIIFVDWRWRRRFGYWYTKTPHACSYYNMLRLLNDKNIKSDPFFISAHGPFAQTRKNITYTHAYFEKFIEKFSCNTVRTANEIAMYAHAAPLLLYPQKRVVPCDDAYYYVQTKRWDRLAYYAGLLRSQKDASPPLFFCINDVGSDTRQQWRRELRATFEAYFPEPSSFERREPVSYHSVHV